MSQVQIVSEPKIHTHILKLNLLKNLQLKDRLPLFLFIQGKVTYKLLSPLSLLSIVTQAQRKAAREANTALVK